MKLFWIKVGGEVLVGQRAGNAELSSAPVYLGDPMVLQYINMPQQSKVVGPSGRQPEIVTGFKFITIPCSEIRLSAVDYMGEVDRHDPVSVTYYKVLEAKLKQQADPLMVAQ